MMLNGTEKLETMTTLLIESGRENAEGIKKMASLKKQVDHLKEEMHAKDEQIKTLFRETRNIQKSSHDVVSQPTEHLHCKRILFFETNERDRVIFQQRMQIERMSRDLFLMGNRLELKDKDLNNLYLTLTQKDEYLHDLQRAFTKLSLRSVDMSKSCEDICGKGSTFSMTGDIVEKVRVNFKEHRDINHV